VRTIARAAALLFALLSLHAAAVEQYGYRVVEKKPQERRLFVQGLEIHDGQLYVSGGMYGQSTLERFTFKDMQQERAQPLDQRLFGEGLTVLGDRVYQLTWRSRIMLVYDRESLTGLNWFRIGGEGWGMTNDGKQLIYSDGSNLLYFLSPETQRVDHTVGVTEDGKPVYQLNELEWVDGQVWANIWRSDRIVIIDPASGEVQASIDLTGLLPADERVTGTDVLNGIARDPADGAIWVTGKRWPWLYHIELVPQEAPQSGADSG